MRLWRTFGDLHRRATRHIHARNRWTGPLWQALADDDAHPWLARGLPPGLDGGRAAPRQGQKPLRKPLRNPLRKRLRKRFDGISIRLSKLERRHPLKMGRRRGHAASSP
jgi:hypothetical protein